MSMHEAAEYVGCSYKTFARSYKEWGIPHYKVTARVTFAKTDLDTWLASRQISA